MLLQCLFDWESAYFVWSFYMIEGFRYNLDSALKKTKLRIVNGGFEVSWCLKSDYVLV